MKYFCKNCNKKLHRKGKTGFCKPCYLEWLILPGNNLHIKHGKYSKSFINKCIDCGTKISRPDATRCLKCNYKFKTGENASGHKHGKTLIESNCIDCGKNIKKYIDYKF